MRLFLSISLLWLSLSSPIFAAPSLNFAPYVQQNTDIALAVTHVASDDVLNMREKPHHNAPIKFKIPYNSSNLVSYDANIVQKLGTNQWVNIRYGVEDGYIDGFVKARYLKLANTYFTTQSPSLKARLPYFLEATTNSKQWLVISKSMSFNHYSGCDMRDDPELLYLYDLFKIKLKAYHNLESALLENLSYDKENIPKYLDKKNNWFKNTAGSYIESNNTFGSAYKVMIGAEGCGLETYFFKKGNKILVMEVPFDHNPPIAASNEKKLKSWKSKHRQLLIQNILENINFK